LLVKRLCFSGHAEESMCNKMTRSCLVGLCCGRENPHSCTVTGTSKTRPIYMNWPLLSPACHASSRNWQAARKQTYALLLFKPVHISFERHLCCPFTDPAPYRRPEWRSWVSPEFGFDHSSIDQTEQRYFIDFISRGAIG
jgi:hypothetical protein